METDSASSTTRRGFLARAGVGTLGMSARGVPDQDPVSVPAIEHSPPVLPYAHDALEPHFDAQTLRLHHENQMLVGAVPLPVCVVREHADYLEYRTAVRTGSRRSWITS